MIFSPFKSNNMDKSRINREEQFLLRMAGWCMLPFVLGVLGALWLLATKAISWEALKASANWQAYFTVTIFVFTLGLALLDWVLAGGWMLAEKRWRARI